jgi:transcriptional regulator with XRE-family HTH domain
MSAGVRRRPKFLSKKLRQIRIGLGLSQTQMGKRLGLDEEFARNYVSGYERNVREPTLVILLGYARLANISTDVLIDDKVDLDTTRALRPRTSAARKKR